MHEPSPSPQPSDSSTPARKEEVFFIMSSDGWLTQLRKSYIGHYYAYITAAVCFHLLLMHGITNIAGSTTIQIR